MPYLRLILAAALAVLGSGAAAAAAFHVARTACRRAERRCVALHGREALDAFKALHTVARARLRRGLLTVVDATNLTERARHGLLRVAGKEGRPVVAIVFDLSLERCLTQNAARPGRRVPTEVVRRHRFDQRLTPESYERAVVGMQMATRADNVIQYHGMDAAVDLAGNPPATSRVDPGPPLDHGLCQQPPPGRTTGRGHQRRGPGGLPRT